MKQNHDHNTGIDKLYIRYLHLQFLSVIMGKIDREAKSHDYSERAFSQPYAMWELILKSLGL